MSSVAEEKKVKVSPFSIEIDTPNNSDYVIASIPGCKLRSALKPNRLVHDNRTGQDVVPIDASLALSSLGELPGMQLYVNPTKCSYEITDPLYENSELCGKIKRFLDSKGMIATNDRISGVPPKEGTLDTNETKTLCREMIRALDSGEAQLVKGIRPSQSDVDGLPGKYLLNPGMQTHTTQPRYEEDYENWVNNLGKFGG